MNADKKFKYWLETAKYDLETAEVMQETGRWLYVMFMCQQAIEKLVKGLYVLYLDDEPPRTHNINFLITKLENDMQILFSEEKKLLFQKLTAHYINGRYPEYRENIGLNLNKTTTGNILKETKDVFTWLLTLKP